MRATQRPVATEKLSQMGRGGSVRGPRVKWLFVQAINWNHHDLDAAAAVLRLAGYNVTTLEMLDLVRVSCRPRQLEPIEFAGDHVVIRPGRNPLRLRMAAAGTLLELARRGHG